MKRLTDNQVSNINRGKQKIKTLIFEAKLNLLNDTSIHGTFFSKRFKCKCLVPFKDCHNAIEMPHGDKYYCKKDLA